MKIYIFPANAPNLHFVLAEDGILLAMCGDTEVTRKAELYRDSFEVEVVSEPWNHSGVESAVRNNKLRARFASNETQMARAELFRWQHGRLPSADGEARALNIHAGAKSMVIGIVQGEATWEGIAVVMSYLLSLLPEQEEISFE